MLPKTLEKASQQVAGQIPPQHNLLPGTKKGAYETVLVAHGGAVMSGKLQASDVSLPPCFGLNGHS